MSNKGTSCKLAPACLKLILKHESPKWYHNDLMDNTNTGIFKIIFTAKRNTLLSEALQIGNDVNSYLVNDLNELKSVNTTIANGIVNSVDDGSFDIGFEVYPNPAKHTISFNDRMGTTTAELYLYDQLGHQIMKTPNLQGVEIDAFNSGIYIYKIVSDKGIFSGKFIVTK